VKTNIIGHGNFNFNLMGEENTNKINEVRGLREL
jgi:hypothetical protein